MARWTMIALVGLAALAIVAMVLLERDPPVAVAPAAAPSAKSTIAPESSAIDASIRDAVRASVEAPETTDEPPPTSDEPAAHDEDVAGGTVIVRVVDATNSQPLPDVRVVLARCPFGREHANEFQIQEVVAGRATDANGLARISADADVEVLARVDPPFLAEPKFVTPDRDVPQEIELRADRGVVLTGRVETRDGKPIKDAGLAVIASRPDGSMTDGLVHGQTDVAGAYTVAPFRLVPGATYRIRASADAYAAATVDVPSPTPGSIVEMSPIVLDPSGIPITGTLVGDSFDVAGKQIELHSEREGLRMVRLESGGAFEFRARAAGVFRLEFDGYCLDGTGVKHLTVQEGSTQYDCGIVRAAAPSTHYTGRVLLTDGTPATAGHVRFGDFSSQIAADGSFDLTLCSPGPLPLDVWWSTGAPHSNERTPNYVFPATTGNVLRVQPRGILVRVVRDGVLTGIDTPVVLDLKSAAFGMGSRMHALPAQWRVDDPFGGAPGQAGIASVTLTVDGKPPVTKDIMLGEGGLRGPEVVVTFEHAELGLE